MRTPVLRELKKNWPQSIITCVVDPIGAEVLSISPDVDDFIIISRDKSNRLRYFWEKIKTQFNLWSRHHDLFIDLYGGASSRFHANATPSRKKIVIHSGKVSARGFSVCKDMPFLNPYHLSNQPLTAIFYINAGGNISVDTRPHIDPNIPALEVFEKKTVNNIINNSGYFFISMGSGDLKKIIDLNIISRLCAFAKNKWNVIPVVALNPGQEFIQKEICEYLNEQSIIYERLPYLSIPALANIIKNSRFVIVPDSGIYHLAIGLGVPILGIFTHTNPELVRPSSGDFEFCFKPDPEKGWTPEGLSYGTRDLKLVDLENTLSLLMQRLGYEV